MSTSEHSRSIRIWIIACFATVAALVGALLVPMVAQATSVELSGSVTGPTGKLLAGVSVSAIEITLGVPSTLATTTTSSTGLYAFAALTAGTDDTLLFGATTTTYQQYLGDTSDFSSAETFALNSGNSAHTTINASLVASGGIAGSVKSITHVALKGYTVRAFANGSDATSVRSAVTSSTGAYSLTGLEPGLYQLQVLDTAANPPYGPVYSGGATSLDSASAVQVNASSTASYSFTLGKAGAISGIVTGDITSGTQPLGDVTVTPYLLTGTPSSFTSSTTTGMMPAVTTSTGGYSLHGLMPGYYTLEFTPGATTPLTSTSDEYGRSFLGGTDGYAVDAAWVHVLGGGTVTGTNEDLEEEASATVNVTDSSTNAPVGNIQVTIDHAGSAADQPGDNAAQTGITDPTTGSVTFHGLGEGFYEVIIGSNTGAGGTITTYQREIAYFNDQLVAGQTSIENVTATLKDAQGLHTIVTPTFSCCGGPPWAVGDVVTVDPQSIEWNIADVDPAKETVQWYRNGVAIPGATGTNYSLQANDAGTMIVAQITAHDLAYGSGTTETDPVGPIDNGTFDRNNDGSLSGTAQVGQTLKYTSSGWNMEGVTETDVWQQSTDGGSTWNPMSTQPIGNTYTLAPTDENSEIRVDVTGTAPGYDSVQYYTGVADVAVGQFTLLTPPKVAATSTTWSVSSGTWSPNAGTTQYLWNLYPSNGGAPTQLTTASISRTGTTGDYVTVSPYREPTGYTAYFAPTIVVQTGTAPTPNSAATISGTPQYNTTLQANVPAFTPSVTTVNCAWQYKSGSTWKAVPGGTLCSYTPVVADIGRTLRVVLTTVKTGYAAGTVIVTEPTAVSALPLTNTSLPQISGLTTTATTISVGTGSWSASPSTFGYHWLYSATGIAPYKAAPGVSTQSSYTIPQSLLGQTLVVDVTASLSGHLTTTVTSTAGTIGKGSLTEVTSPKAKLSGTTVTGQTLTGYGATFSPTPTTIGYYWYVYDQNNSLPVTNGPGPSYSIPTAYEHDYIDVQAEGSLTGYQSPTFGASVLAKKGDEIPTGSLSISGNAVGASITSSGLSWSVDSSTLSYQWQYKYGTTWKSIVGATASSFTPNSTYLGKTLRLVETASATNFNSASAISGNTVTVIDGAAPTPGTGGAAPELAGGLAVGDTLTVTPGTWSLTGTTFTYQWQTSPDGTTWTNIPGATSSHALVPVSAYLTPSYVGVVITASKAGYAAGTTRVASPGKAVEGSVTLVKAPTVKVVGTKLTVSAGTWSAATAYSYEWATVPPDGGSITSVGTNSPSYTPVAGDAGKAIYVVVVASAPNYMGANAQVLARSGGPITPVTPITVTGTAGTGSTLTATSGAFSVVSPNLFYQWYRSGKAITGATLQDYSPVTADIGTTLSVTVTVSQTGWTTEKYSAASTTTQNGASIAYSAPPSITGSPTVDSVLTAINAAWTETGVSVTYQWYRGGSAILGATSSKYTVTAIDLGNDISVWATGSKLYQQPTPVQGGPLTIGIGAILAPATPVKIAGTVAIGKVLAATSGAWNFPVTLTYEWQYEAPASSTWNDISGADASTYTPSVADGIVAGGSIQLIIHASRPGHSPVALTSAAVTVT